MKARLVIAVVLCVCGTLLTAAAHATVYQPLSQAQPGGPQVLSSDPFGSAYDAALYISAINPGFPEPLESAPDEFAWTGGSHDAGNNFFSGVGLTMLQTYAPGAGPNGGDIIQVNIFSNDSSPLVPSGTEINGRQPDTLQFHVGTGQKSNPIDTDTPQTILSSGMVVFQDGVPVSGTLALISVVNIGGVGHYSPGGPIDGLGMDEVAMFWEVTPEPGSLSALALGAMLVFRRRR